MVWVTRTITIVELSSPPRSTAIATRSAQAASRSSDASAVRISETSTLPQSPSVQSRKVSPATSGSCLMSVRVISSAPSERVSACRAGAHGGLHPGGPGAVEGGVEDVEVGRLKRGPQQLGRLDLAAGVTGGVAQQRLHRHLAGDVTAAVGAQAVGDGEDQPRRLGLGKRVFEHANAPPAEAVLVLGAHRSRFGAAGVFDRQTARFFGCDSAERTSCDRG